MRSIIHSIIHSMTSFMVIGIKGLEFEAFVFEVGYINGACFSWCNATNFKMPPNVCGSISCFQVESNRSGVLIDRLCDAISIFKTGIYREVSCVCKSNPKKIRRCP